MISRGTFRKVAAATVVVGTLAVAAPAAAKSNDDWAARAENVIRCEVIDGERFCTEIGFVDIDPASAAWRAYIAELVAAPVSEGGDASLRSIVVDLEGLSRKQLAARQKAQIDDARKAVGKTKLYDLLADQTPIPSGFFSEHPELNVSEKSDTSVALRALATSGLSATDAKAGATTANAVVATGTLTIPTSALIMSGNATEQILDNYCGPAVMQMIAWSDSGELKSQDIWASSLRTDLNGTSISNMVRVLNANTNYDAAAGAYTVQSSSGKSLDWFRSVHLYNIGVAKAPVIEHVQLLKTYFTYLRYNHSGHFQVGRGYDSNATSIRIIDPYDERDFISDGYDTAGTHTMSAQIMLNATNANSLKNLGA